MSGPLPRAAGPLAVAAGLAHALAIAWPWGLDASWLGLAKGQPVWWLQLASLAALMALLQRCASVRGAGLLGWAFATAMLSGTFWWLFISMHTYGGLHAGLAVLAVLGLAAFLGSYYAMAAALWAKLARGQTLSPWAQALLFAALWTLAELARNSLWTGFPWGAGGYAHLAGPLSGWPRVLGALGTGALAAGLAALPVLLRGRTLARPLLALAGLTLAIAPPAALNLPWGAWAPEAAGSAGKLSVTLLQGNIPQDEKFQPGSGVPLALRWYGEQLLAADTALVVGPETAVPLLPEQLPEGYWDALTRRFGGARHAALLGIPLGSFAQGYTNSVIGLRPGQAQPYRYDKHHLVPFGEFIPPGFRWFTELMAIPLGDFNRGAVGQPSFAWQGQRLAPHICYEDLFGEELGARFIDPAAAPTVFVNVSNIGWFGDSVAIDQHLLIARMRALEFERPFVRATNTGATVVIDHHGAVTHSLPRLTRGVLVAEVDGRTGTTPFAWWVARLGLWPLGVLALAVVLGVRGAGRRPR